MLYTLSQACMDKEELQALLSTYNVQDALVLWQDGVLQAVKNPDFFAKLPNVFVLEEDLSARALHCNLPTINLADFVRLTEQYFPQMAL
jgi:tRNA 2-thiouridine synthesizing protein B